MTLTPHGHSPGPGRISLSLLDWFSILVSVAMLTLLLCGYVTAEQIAPAAHAAPASGTQAQGDGAAMHGPPAAYQTPPLWACLPFAAILLAIAVLPLIPATKHWWESNKNRLSVSLALSVLTLLFYGLVHPMTFNHETFHTYTGARSVAHVLEHAVLIEYVPFIVLLFSLYVISGGISLRGDLPAHPATNTLFLAAGGALASFVGTTGAGMLLIRPVLQTNSERKHVRHTVIFFIFIVCNCGGLLLPIGDPPLFLGYLRGVPFLWTVGLIWEWMLVMGCLLAIYFLWDTLAYRAESPKDVSIDETQRTRLQLAGKLNFLFLLGVVFCVALIDPSREFLGLGFRPFRFMRELMMLGLVALSLLTTDKANYRANQFNYHAILEVAALFIGIFICMQVPIEILHQKGADLGLSKPWHFFWTTGALSSFLDNAPTYVVFFETARVLPAGADAIILVGGEISAALLTAISLGAVFMGAMTYIGNGPNFMVKSIAEQSGVRMPSFFGYMCYSVAILVPLCLLVTVVFVRS